MKVSFSRKGFDSSCGGQANAILPDGTLLPFPIPSNDGYPHTYDSIYHGEQSIYDILAELRVHPNVSKNMSCHLDPDLRRDVTERLEGWRPAFGQSNQSLTELSNNNFGIGSLFLFFGWFRETEYHNGKLQYKRNAPNIHLIYGYMEVGEIIRAGNEVPEWLLAHPHAMRIKHGSIKDAIFLPKDKLSFAPEQPGSSMLDYRPELVLTAPGMSRSKWKLPDFFDKENIKIGHAPKQPENGSYFQSAKIGQEMIWEATETAISWLQNICKNE